MRLKIACSLIIAILATPVAVGAETIVGRWCDRQLPTMPKFNAVLTIAVTNSGNAVMLIKWGDGSSKRHSLQESGGGIYKKVGSSSGDRYRIVSSTGNLQLLDNAGVIRIARRLENKPQRGDCIE